MKKIPGLLMLICGMQAMGQSLQPSVMNASGGTGSVTSGTQTVNVYYSIGEPIIDEVQNTSANTMLTQGFLQPDLLGHVGLSFSPMVSNESCLDKNDGKILLTLNSAPFGTSYEKYIWTPSTVCPNNNCASLDSLAPGNYSVTIKAYSSSNVALDSVKYTYNIVKSTEACQITVYTGFTPNNDGKNDVMYIENIESFPENKVYIYNRWGNKIIQVDGYNNTSHAWDGRSQNGTAVPAGTYFYVIELEKGASVKKGWIELTASR